MLQPHFWAHNQKRQKLTGKDACTPMFIAALFAIANIWKQPPCPSTRMDKEDVVYIYDRILLSLKKRMKYCHLQQHGWT